MNPESQLAQTIKELNFANERKYKAYTRLHSWSTISMSYEEAKIVQEKSVNEINFLERKLRKLLTQIIQNPE